MLYEVSLVGFRLGAFDGTKTNRKINTFNRKQFKLNSFDSPFFAPEADKDLPYSVYIGCFTVK